MALIERRKGEQPQFLSNYNHNLNISTFRKFETEKCEIQQCDKELLEIKNMIKSCDPIYEGPFLYLLSIHVNQYKEYIIQQRFEYNIISEQETEQKRDDKEYFEQKEMNTMKMQQQFHFEQNSQHQYRKKKYIYQSDDGQLIFLHPHNYNMIKYDMDYDFELFPALLTNCKILEIERYQQSYDLRRKYPFLAFIPVDVSFSFVEIDLSQNNNVSASTLKYFAKTTMGRQQNRIEQEKLAEKETKHQQIMEEQRIALQKQKYARPQIDINDYREFPSLASPATDESNSNSDNSAENNNKPNTRSWSQITLNKSDDKQKSLDSPSLISIASPNNKSVSIGSSGGGSGGSANKRKRRRGGRNKKKNKNKEKERYHLKNRHSISNIKSLNA